MWTCVILAFRPKWSASHRPKNIDWTHIMLEVWRQLNLQQESILPNFTAIYLTHCNLFNACWHLSRRYHFKLQMSNMCERSSKFRKLIPSCMWCVTAASASISGQETAVCWFLWRTDQSRSCPLILHPCILEANPWRQLCNSENDSARNMTSAMLITAKYTTSEQLLHKMRGERASLSNTILNWQTIYDGGLWEMD